METKDKDRKKREETKKDQTTTSLFPDMAKETRDTVGTGRIYSNGRGRKNKYSDS